MSKPDKLHFFSSFAHAVLAVLLVGTLAACSANKPAVPTDSQATDNATADSPSDGKANGSVSFDDVVLVDNEIMTMTLTGFHTEPGGYNGADGDRYFADVVIRNNSDIKILGWIEDGYIGDSSVVVSIDGNYMPLPGKTMDKHISVWRQDHPTVMLDSMDELYDLEFGWVVRGNDEDYYHDDYLHDLFETRVLFPDLELKPNE